MRDFKRNLGNHDHYNPYSLAKTHTEDELRQEYTRLRDNLRRNVSRTKADPDFQDAQIVKTYQRFAKPSELTDTRSLAMALSDLEGVMSSQLSTLSGLKAQRESVLDTLQTRGYTEITKKNFSQFTAFMESTKALAFSILRYKIDKKGRRVGEDRNKRLELFTLAQQKGLTNQAIISDFKFFVQHIDELKQLPDRPDGRKMGARTARKALKNI